MPQHYDLSVYTGDTGTWEFAFWHDTYRSKPYDLSGATEWLSEIRAEPGAQVKAVMTVTPVNKNTLRLELSSDDSRLPLTGELFYDIQGTWPDRVTTMVKGRVVREGDISDSDISG